MENLLTCVCVRAAKITNTQEPCYQYIQTEICFTIAVSESEYFFVNALDKIDLFLQILSVINLISSDVTDVFHLLLGMCVSV